MNDSELLRYGRHILLEDIGIEGQEAFARARVALVGCGGTAAAALLYLAAAGIGELWAIDDDVVEMSNLQRQILFTENDIGKHKAEVAAQYLNRRFPVKVRAFPRRADEALLAELLPEVDALLDCSDNFATRHIVNRAAKAHALPLISGAATAFRGQLAVFDFRLPGSPCYDCIFPESDDERGGDGVCALFGVFAPLPGIIGAMQAAETLKLLLPRAGNAEAFLFDCDALSGKTRRLAVAPDPDCPVCAHK